MARGIRGTRFRDETFVSHTLGPMTGTQAGPTAGRRRWIPWLTGGILLLSAGFGVGWAVTTVLTPAEDALDSTPYTYVAVEQGDVGASLQLDSVAEWAPAPVGANRAAGVVTGVSVTAGEEVSQGSTLYSVDLRPVVVAEGDVPAFRAMGAGVEGPDVAQLQKMLTAGGFYSGPADGRSGTGTVRAIRSWQKSIGVPETGTVGAGDVIFVPSLPARVVLDSKVIFRGATLAGGEDAVQGLPAAPSFGVPVTEGQAAMMPAGTRVLITSPEGAQWAGYAAGRTTDADTGVITIALEGEGGEALCGDQCGQVPVTGQSMLRSEVVTVETVSGLVVPSAALVTQADGQTAVIEQGGERIPVTVVAAARGMSVVEGVSAGTRVRVPAAKGS